LLGFDPGLSGAFAFYCPGRRTRSQHGTSPSPGASSTALSSPALGYKEQARALALGLWPGCTDTFARKKDHGRAEAALLAKFAAETIAA
jgi:hypothetical protein